jgi:hypothetical protein
VPTRTVQSIDWIERKVRLALAREEILAPV